MSQQTIKSTLQELYGKSFLQGHTEIGASPEQTILKTEAAILKLIKEMVNDYWKFDNRQQPISSWHDKQDFLDRLEEIERGV